MYHKYHTKGIVLASKIEGSDSKRLTILTEDFGLINTRVQGVRNIYSKLRPGAQDFSFGDFSLVHGKTGWKMVSGKTEKNLFEAFRNSPYKLKVLGNILNLVNKLIDEETRINDIVQQHTPTSIFGVIKNFVIFLHDAKENDVNLAECLVLLRILHALGYMREDPELSIPLASSEIDMKDLELIAPRRLLVISLINESLKATQI